MDRASSRIRILIPPPATTTAAADADTDAATDAATEDAGGAVDATRNSRKPNRT